MEKILGAAVENSRSYTLQVAETMPEKNYGFRPANAGWTFAELLLHIAYGIEWWQKNYIEQTRVDWNPPTSNGNSKEKVIQQLRNAYDALSVTVAKGKLSDEQRHGFYATLDHVTHHRGQAVLYLRCSGLTPPEYQF